MKTTFFILICALLAGIFLSSCQPNAAAPSPSGAWHAQLLLSTERIPFELNIQESQPGKYLVSFINGEEVIRVEDAYLKKDSIFISFPVFDARLAGKIEGNSFSGNFFNDARTNKNVIPFTARKGKFPRFPLEGSPNTVIFEGKWEVTFIYQDTDTSKAIGEFKQEGNHLAGTFITPTGDYRYLEGIAKGDSMFLSCFDGAHAFLFKAKMNDQGQLEGGFWSGDHWYETWTAVKNEAFELPDAHTLTYLKEGYDKLAFSFPDLDGNPVSLDDPKFQGKVVIVQILGSWCPNCWDETVFLADLYNRYRDSGLEIIGLGYERMDDFEKAAALLRKLQNKAGAEYTFLVAGKAGKDAAQSLPMLNHIMSYPTTIFIDKKGDVRNIHTGFTGPASPERYQAIQQSFKSITESLIGE